MAKKNVTGEDVAEAEARYAAAKESHGDDHLARQKAAEDLVAVRSAHRAAAEAAGTRGGGGGTGLVGGDAVLTEEN